MGAIYLTISIAFSNSNGFALLLSVLVSNLLGVSFTSIAIFLFNIKSISVP